jgi:hypothetical protein
MVVPVSMTASIDLSAAISWFTIKSKAVEGLVSAALQDEIKRL